MGKSRYVAESVDCTVPVVCWPLSRLYIYIWQFFWHFWRCYGTSVNNIVDYKVHYSQNTFTGLNFSNFTIFHPKICFKNFWKHKNLKIPSWIRTHGIQICSSFNPLQYNVLGKKLFMNLPLILLFILIKTMSQHGGVQAPIPP